MKKETWTGNDPETQVFIASYNLFKCHDWPPLCQILDTTCYQLKAEVSRCQVCVPMVKHCFVWRSLCICSMTKKTQCYVVSVCQRCYCSNKKKPKTCILWNLKSWLKHYSNGKGYLNHFLFSVMDTLDDAACRELTQQNMRVTWNLSRKLVYFYVQYSTRLPPKFSYFQSVL